MENPVIKGIRTFSDRFTLSECNMGKLIPKGYTSGHSGEVGVRIGKNEMNVGRKSPFSVTCRQAKNEASYIWN